MIVTRSWLQEWIDLNGISTAELAKILNSIGLEVDKVKSFHIPNKIVFGHVLECEKHPDAEKLSVCKVDIGSSIRQIVCGASNVKKGLHVAVATIGAKMDNGVIIKPVKLRGIDSEGMICSAKEIGLIDCTDGILEIDESIGEFIVGHELCENKILEDDLIEIELTANRGDCLSIRGVARDLSAALDRPLKEKTFLENEDRQKGIGRILNLTHEKNLSVNLRYKAIELQNLVLPIIVKLRLAQIEDKRASDIESLMLYTTHSTGVILRAYDYSFFCAENETMARIELHEDENGYACIMSKEKASTIGIIQEDASKVSYDAGTVLIEASYIPPDIIAKQMSVAKIASGPMYYKTSRGSEPELDQGLSFCLNLINLHSNSSIFGGNIDLSDVYNDTIITLNKQEIDEIIGAKINKVKITKILKNLGFETNKTQGDNFVISVPRFRHDIANKQDIIEEIVRMVGIENIPSKPFIFTEENRLEDDYFEYKKKRTYRHKAANNGFFETVHFIFDERKILEKYGFTCTNEELELLNPIISTLDTLRPTLLTGLLKAASQNAKNTNASIRLFEVGSVFSPLREESLRISLLWSANKEQEALSNFGKPTKVDFAFFVQKISDIVGAIELKEHKTLHTLSHMYQTAQLLVEGVVVGELFRVNPIVEKEYDLDITFMCEIDFSKLPFGLKTAKKISKYQASFRDLSIVMPQNIPYEKVKAVIEANSSDEVISFYPVDKYTDASLGENMSLSVRFMLQSDEKTLEEEEINLSMENILAALKNNLGVSLR